MEPSEQPNLYVVDMDDNKVIFERSASFVDGYPSASLLFQALRDALVALIPEGSREYWLIKFCSRVTNSSMPMLHNPVTYQVLIDPLQCVRDPIKELQVTRRLELFYYPSKPYFYRKRPNLDGIQQTASSPYQS